MDCPSCNGNSFVVQTKMQFTTQTVLRIRKCKECGLRFKTVERVLKKGEI